MTSSAAAPFAAATLRTHDPSWDVKWEAQYEKALDLWRAALRELKEEGAVRAETKAAWVDTIQSRKAARKRSARTVADVASRIFNIVAGRAALMGQSFDRDHAPSPESFATLRDVRLFFMSEMERIREKARKPAPAPAFRMPVMPPNADIPFSGPRSRDLTTQAVYLPDVDGGMAMVVTHERRGDVLNICLSGRSSPARFRAFLPQLATALSQRMFAGDDPRSMRFYVHHPLQYGPNGCEQYWFYDLSPDARGRFQFSGQRNLLQVLPDAIAHKRFADGLPEAQTQAIVLDADRRAPGLAPFVSDAEMEEIIPTGAGAPAAAKPRLN